MNEINYEKNFWRPFTQEALSKDRVKIETAKNCSLFDKNNKEYLDLISSWWTVNHGHGNETICNAIKDQFMKIDHIIASDFASQPALDVIQKLKSFLDKSFEKFFFSDNGSTSVEVAMKIAYQFFANQGQKKDIFISLAGGYHGDTFGAMSVGLSSGFFDTFKNLTFTTHSISYPETWNDDHDVKAKERKSIAEFQALISNNKNKICAIILEPLIQGASGMRVSRPEFIKTIHNIAKENDILVIFDEVMTGFGRTGNMFAYQSCDVVPDIICMSKGLTGGVLPLGVTAVSAAIYEKFYSKNISKTFFHSHSFTANPVICAAASASIGMFNDTLFEKITTLSGWYKEEVKELDGVEKVRILGSICAFDVSKIDDEYGSEKSIKFKYIMMEKGFFLRPLGKTVYILPPYCISRDEIKRTFVAIKQTIDEI